MKPVKRILLGNEQAKFVANLVNKLREDSCKVDASRIVNEILDLFSKKYTTTEFRNLREKFFDKKNYLKRLINCASSEDIDESIKQYLSKTKPSKKRGRKPKSSIAPHINEEAPSS